MQQPSRRFFQWAHNQPENIPASIFQDDEIQICEKRSAAPAPRQEMIAASANVDQMRIERAIRNQIRLGKLRQQLGDMLLHQFVLAAFEQILACIGAIEDHACFIKNQFSRFVCVGRKLASFPNHISVIGHDFHDDFLIKRG
jgi:hypothetical protein